MPVHYSAKYPMAFISVISLETKPFFFFFCFTFNVSASVGLIGGAKKLYAKMHFWSLHFGSILNLVPKLI